ncbi:hypothetical protein [Cohnella sp. 56]|uniref:hypothetical protein n=1 Tax=Cohnella sp. 56 TaxID=3113722 RepID=UPI0030E7D9CD
MANDTIGDLKMDGIGTAAGGVYRLVNLNGVCKVAADVEAQVFDADGQIRVNGHLTAGELDLDGTMRVSGTLHAERAFVDGMATIEQSYAGQQLQLNGMLSAGGDCELDLLEGEGVFKIRGLLNAGSIKFRLQGRSSAREIGCETIRVGRGRTGVWRALWQWVLPSFTPELKAGVIEGDDVELEYASVGIVRGDRVTIGRGCDIGRVEYRTGLRKHPTARIGEEAKLNG